MKKGILLTGLTLATAVLASLGLVACKETPEPEKGCGAFGEYVEYVLNEDGKSYTLQMFSGEEIRNYQSYEDFLSANGHITAITGELVIPSTYDGKPVTGIGAYAFASCSFDKVVLPDSVTDIGFNAFASCDDLLSVTLGLNLKTVGFGAFTECYKLVEVYNRSNLQITAGGNGYGEVAKYAKDVYTQEFESKITKDNNGYVTYLLEDGLSLVNYVGGHFTVNVPDGVTEINGYAFAGYDELISIEFPKTLKSIKTKAFNGCGELRQVYVSDIKAFSEIVYEEYEAQPFNYASELYLGSELVTHLQLPETVTQVSDYAFYSVESLVSLTLPSTMEKINDYAFAWCKNLENVTLSQTLQTIGAYAFTGCGALKKIDFSDNVQEIQASAFSRSGLMEASIPNSVKILGQGVFNACRDLTSVTLGNGLTAISKETFYDCEKLSQVNMSDSIQTIASFAFGNCFALENIRFSSQLNEIGESAFFSCTNLKTLLLPDSLSYIGIGAFEYCESLQNVLLGSGLKTVTHYAFYGCDALLEIYYKGDAENFAYIQISENNPPFENATIYYYSEKPPATEGDFWHWENGQIKKYE